MFLFGIEFSETAIIFTENGIYIVTSENKGTFGYSEVSSLAKNYLSPMIDKVINAHSIDCETKIFTRKRNDSNQAMYEELKSLFSTSFSAVLLITPL